MDGKGGGSIELNLYQERRERRGDELVGIVWDSERESRMNDILALNTAKRCQTAVCSFWEIEQVSCEVLEILLNILDKIEIDLNIEFRSEEALDQNNTNK